MSNESEEDVEEEQSQADEELESLEESTDEETDDVTDADTEEAADDETEADATEDTSEADEAEDADEDADETGLDDGDFILLDYTAYTIEDERLVDTTDEDTAVEEGIDQEGREFEPRTIVIGKGHIFPSVEDDLRGREVGDTGTATVSCEEAFGEFDDEKVRTVSKDKIPEDDRYPGAQVSIDGEEGFVETIIGGRARVDFNHPLAGDDIEYEYEIVDVVEDRDEKAAGLLELFLGVQPEMWFQTDTVEEEQLVEDDDEEETDDESEAADGGDEEETDTEEADEGDEAEETEDEEEDDEPEYETVEVEKETLYIESTPELTMNQQWMFQKQQIGEDMIELLDIDRIIVQDVIEAQPVGMPGMMGGMGGMGGLEEALGDLDIDADELADELE